MKATRVIVLSLLAMALLVVGCGGGRTEAEKHYNKGVEYAEEGRLDDAIAEYTKAIELDPDLAEAHFSRGYAYYKLGESQRAVEGYNEAIELDPDLAEAYGAEVYGNQDEHYHSLGQLPRYIEENLSDFVRLHPQDPNAYRNRGNAYYRVGQFERAIEDYTMVIELAPDSDPDFAAYYLNRGNAHYKLGQFERAIEDYTMVIEIIPSVGTFYANRALAHTALGNDQEAERDIEKAVELGYNADLLREAVEELKAQRQPQLS